MKKCVCLAFVCLISFHLLFCGGGVFPTALAEELPADNVDVFFLAGEITDGITATQTIAKGSVPVLPGAPSKVGFRFTGWRDDTGAIYTSELPAAFATTFYYACWDIVNYDVYYFNNDGTVFESARGSILSDLTSVDAPHPSSGEVFKGWYNILSGRFVDSTTAIHSTTYLVAVFEPTPSGLLLFWRWLINGEYALLKGILALSILIFAITHLPIFARLIVRATAFIFHKVRTLGGKKNAS